MTLAIGFYYLKWDQSNIDTVETCHTFAKEIIDDLQYRNRDQKFGILPQRLSEDLIIVSVSPLSLGVGKEEDFLWAIGVKPIHDFSDIDIGEILDNFALY